MNVLISGGAGFIGTHLSRELLRRGHAVTVLDNFSPQIHAGVQDVAADLRGHVRLLHADVRNRDAWQQALPGHQAVVHFAAETGTGQSMYEVSRYEQVNLAGTAHLYDLLAQQTGRSVERIVVASSRSIYGEGAYLCSQHGTVYPQPRSSADKKLGMFDPLCPVCSEPCVSVPTPESAPLQPSSFYGLTKQVQEQMTMLFATVLRIPSFALRYQNVFGPGQSLNNPYTGILAVFSNLARTGQAINVFEDGRESRDFVYVGDVVRATADSIDMPGAASHALNVGSGVATTVKEIAQHVNVFFGGKSAIGISGAFREGDIRHGLADLRQSRAVLGYNPQVSFAEGLHNFLQWAEGFSSNADAYGQSLIEMKQRGLLHDHA